MWTLETSRVEQGSSDFPIPSESSCRVSRKLHTSSGQQDKNSASHGDTSAGNAQMAGTPNKSWKEARGHTTSHVGASNGNAEMATRQVRLWNRTDGLGLLGREWKSSWPNVLHLARWNRCRRRSNSSKRGNHDPKIILVHSSLPWACFVRVPSASGRRM